MSDGWRNWLYLAFHAFFSSGAGVFAVSMIAPNEINLDHPWRLFSAATALGSIGVWQYFAQAKAPWEAEKVQTGALSDYAKREVARILEANGLDSKGQKV